MKNDEGISICPTELRKLLKEMNALPPELKDLKIFSAELDSLNLQSDPQELADFFSRDAATFAKPIFQEKGFLNAQMYLRRLIGEKETLLNIVWHCRDVVETKWINPGGYMLANPIYNYTFSFDPERKSLFLTIGSFRVFEILTKYPVDRVRICPIPNCRAIFWAKRTESPACKESHVTAFNSAKTRIKESEQKLENENKILEEIKSMKDEVLIKQQELKIRKLSVKIAGRKRKYGIV